VNSNQVFDLNELEHLRIYSRGIGPMERTRKYWICRQHKANPVGSQVYFTRAGGWHVPYGKAAHKLTREFSSARAAHKVIVQLGGKGEL
jgi:hypothetical protein